MSGEFPTDQDFVEMYGADALMATKDGGEPMPLGFALMLEQDHCEVPDERRLDPKARAQFLARSINRAGQTPLAREHLYLLDQEG